MQTELQIEPADVVLGKVIGLDTLEYHYGLKPALWKVATTQLH